MLMTPVARRKFDKDGKLVDTHGEYPDIVRAVAKEQKVPLIDMLRRRRTCYRVRGRGRLACSSCS